MIELILVLPYYIVRVILSLYMLVAALLYSLLTWSNFFDDYNDFLEKHHDICEEVFL